MKIVQINSVCGSGSTGKICVAVSELLNSCGTENYVMYACGVSNYSQGVRYMSSFEVKVQALKSKLFGNYGFQTQAATKRLIEKLDKINPDIVHLHNLHSHNVNLKLLFAYFKAKNTKLYWTFHDCWAFTGYCPHYDMIGCDKWKNEGCHNCPQRRHYSWIFDRSKALYNKKKELFTGLNLTIITPSKWLADQVKQSFLSEYEVKVINNGIDLSVFKPRESDFRIKHGLEDKFIVLGVAFDWGVRKGLDVFIELSKRLDERFKIVLVGTNENVDKELPKNIISIHRTQNQIELAEIYTAADVFVNPTREENFPTTHLEALACGTPVVAFNIGGCYEMLDETCGCIVEKNKVDALEKAIIKICTQKMYESQNCTFKAEKFSAKVNFEKYQSLYVYQSC